MTNKRSKTKDRASRLAAKRLKVKRNKHNDDHHLPAPVGQKHRRTSPKARVSRLPRVLKGTWLAKSPSRYVGRLTRVSDWLRQVGKIYREMRKEQIDPSLGTKLTFVANIGANIARWVEETLPKGVDIPPNYDLLSADELAQLEFLLAKAAGNQQRITIDQGNADE
jgi:hypothetical protein